MIQVAKDDVLRGLKRFKRLAKQDLLASGLTSNPRFWTVQAETRRNTYDKLMELVEQQGVNEALEFARHEHASLPPEAFDGEEVDPEISGKKQALELFFTILGLGATGQPAAEHRLQDLVEA